MIFDSFLCYFFSRLIEYDSNIQEEVSKMPPLIDKLIFMIDRCQSQPAGYSLFSSQVASNTLFYCTFNVKSAQPLVDCGALEKMINITRNLLIDNDSNTPLRWEVLELFLFIIFTIVGLRDIIVKIMFYPG